MKLNTGKVAFPIEFDNGDKDTIYFNPSDPDLAVRFKDFQARVDEKTKDLKDVELNADGTPKDAEYIEVIREAQKIICEELDIAFGNVISSVVFKYCSPLALVNGDYFILQFLEAIEPEIKEKNQQANAEAEKKMQKHIAKYNVKR